MAVFAAVGVVCWSCPLGVQPIVFAQLSFFPLRGGFTPLSSSLNASLLPRSDPTERPTKRPLFGTATVWHGNEGKAHPTTPFSLGFALPDSSFKGHNGLGVSAPLLFQDSATLLS